MIRDVAWIADTLAHDAYVKEIYRIGPVDPIVCVGCWQPLTGRELRAATSKSFRRPRCADCRARVYLRERNSYAVLKAAGRCSCGRVADRDSGRVTCSHCVAAAKRRAMERTAD